MDDKDRRVLRKLQEHTEAVLRYCKDCTSLSDFEADPMRVEATVFNLMQIGELAKNSLSDAAKEALPAIPWRQIYGMRNRIVHGWKKPIGRNGDKIGFPLSPQRMKRLFAPLSGELSKLSSPLSARKVG